MIIGDSVLIKTDGSVSPVYPVNEKFTEEELISLVGGDFYLVRTANEEKCFVINTSVSNTSYNINANYLFRRFVDDVVDLRGQVLLCNCEMIDVSVITASYKAINPIETDLETQEALE
jgi:hypothetical protein